MKVKAHISYTCKLFFFSMFFTSMFSFIEVEAQECVSSLKEAESRYNEGDLESTANLLSCLIKKDKRLQVGKERNRYVDALKLLTETHLYLNDIDKASKAYEQLLKIDPLFIANPEAEEDSKRVTYDLHYLSKTYQSRPLLKIYMGAGINYSLMQILQNYGTNFAFTSSAEVNKSVLTSEDYRPRFIVGGNMTVGANLHIWRNFSCMIEITGALRNFDYLNKLYISPDVNNPIGNRDKALASEVKGDPLLLYSTLEFREFQYWLDFPICLRYDISLDGKMQGKKIPKVYPYVYVGFTPHVLVGAQLSNLKRSTTKSNENNLGGQIVESEAGINLSSDKMRTVLNYSVNAGAGVNFRVGKDFIFLDVRYNRYLLNSINRANRYNNETLLYDYNHVDNDLRMDNIAFSIGYVKAIYQPRKKTIYNPRKMNTVFNKWVKKKKDRLARVSDEKVKRELSSAIKEAESKQPQLLNDMKRGYSGGSQLKDIMRDIDRQFDRSADQVIDKGIKDATKGL